MTGASPIITDLAAIRSVLTAARALGGPIGTAVELCILTLLLPWEVVAIRLEQIDWQDGFVPVPARGRGKRLLSLPTGAQNLILRIAGEGGGNGQAITAGRGEPLQARHLRLDRIVPRLVAANGAPLPAWNFHGLRWSAGRIMHRRGMQPEGFFRIFGMEQFSSQKFPEWVRIKREREGMEQWAALLADR